MSIADIGLCIQGIIGLLTALLAIWPPKSDQQVLARVLFGAISLLTFGAMYIGIRQNHDIDREQIRSAALQKQLLLAQKQITQDEEVVRQNSEDEVRVRKTKQKIRADLNALMGEGQKFYADPDPQELNRWTRRVSNYLKTNEFLDKSYCMRFDNASPSYPLNHSTAHQGIGARYMILQNIVLELKD